MGQVLHGSAKTTHAVRAELQKGRGSVAHVFGRVCAERGVEHRLTKPYHPWTNGQAERMVRTIKEATVRDFHYAPIDDLRRHVRDWLLTYAKQLKALRFKTPLEAIKSISAEKPELFVRQPSHDMLGLNT
jgi:transposase InsO family protein